MNLHISRVAMRRKALRLVPSAIVGAALLGATTASALAAPALPACVSVAGGTTVVTLVPDANGQPSLPCIPQPGQELVIAGGSSLTNALATPPTTQTFQNVKPGTPTPIAIDAQPVDDHLGTMLDPRVDTYAKRQAIRDKYRGLINETTFNDELSDGVSLDQALADAMAELGKTQ